MDQPVNRLATPLPDAVLDRYYNDPEHPERQAEDPRRRHGRPRDAAEADLSEMA